MFRGRYEGEPLVSTRLPRVLRRAHLGGCSLILRFVGSWTDAPPPTPSPPPPPPPNPVPPLPKLKPGLGVTMAELAQFLEFPKKEKGGATAAAVAGGSSGGGGDRGGEPLLRQGPAKCRGKSGWFRGAALEDRHLFLGPDCLVVACPEEDRAAKKGGASPRTPGSPGLGVLGALADAGKKYVAEAVLDLRAAKLRDVPLQGDAQDAFEV